MKGREEKKREACGCKWHHGALERYPTTPSCHAVKNWNCFERNDTKEREVYRWRRAPSIYSIAHRVKCMGCTWSNEDPPRAHITFPRRLIFLSTLCLIDELLTHKWTCFNDWGGSHSIDTYKRKVRDWWVHFDFSVDDYCPGRIHVPGGKFKVSQESIGRVPFDEKKMVGILLESTFKCRVGGRESISRCSTLDT